MVQRNDRDNFKAMCANCAKSCDVSLILWRKFAGWLRKSGGADTSYSQVASLWKHRFPESSSQ